MLKQLKPSELIAHLIRRIRPPSKLVEESQVRKDNATTERLDNFQKRSSMLISVDGNISSGKSSLVAKLTEHFTSKTLAAGTGTNGFKQHGLGTEERSPAFELEIIPEPLDKWCNLNGYNLLELFYKEPTKYNFLFQHYVQLTRLMDTINTCSNPTSNNGTSRKIRIMERSLQNNRYCFVELARRNEKIEPAEFIVLSEWYSWLESKMDLSLDVIIYLRTNPETAYSRMMGRGRSEEASCPLSYLVDLHEAYEDWLVRGKTQDTKKRQHVIVIDANKSREEVASDCIESVTKFLFNSSNKLSNGNGIHDSQAQLL